MTSGRSVLPASSGYQSQSAACASAGSAQRSPSWWCGGRPRAGQQTAAAPHTGEKERQKAGRFRSETRRWWFPRAQKAFHTPLEALPTPHSILHQIHAHLPWTLLSLCLQLRTTVAPFLLDPIFCPSPLTPGISFSTCNSLLLKLICVCFSCTTSHIPVIPQLSVCSNLENLIV